MKIMNLFFALSCFGVAMAILPFAEDAVGYALVTWNLMGAGLMIWQGRLWK